MAFRVNAPAAPGSTLVITIERISDGFYFNPSSGVFENTPTFANKKIAMIEGANADVNENDGSYTVSLATVDGSPGSVRVRIHDDAATGDPTLDLIETAIENDAEVTLGTIQNIVLSGALKSNVDDATPSASTFDGDAGLSAADGEYVNSLLAFINGPNKGQWRPISGYTGATRTFTFTDVFPNAPNDGDEFLLSGYHT